MLLCIDIGNTAVTLGVFDGERLSTTLRVATDTRRLADEYGVLLTNLLRLKGIEPDEVAAACICSVVPPLTQVFEELGAAYFGCPPLVVGTGTRTGVRILYENPRDVGADRVADAAAAYWLYGGPVIVVDFGTATVFDAISGDGDYLGGAIASGINLTAEALYQRTSQLRRVELVAPKTAIGRNTATAIQSGILFGHVGMVEAMVGRFKREMGEDTQVVATGGMASLVHRETTIFDHVNPELTLIGLRIIHKLNADSARPQGGASND